MSLDLKSAIETVLLLAKENQIVLALDLATNLLSQHPKNPALLHLIGKLKQSQGKFEEALIVVRSASEIAPQELSYKATLATLYGQLDKHKEAISQYLALLKIEPKNKHILNNLGVSYGKVGLHNDAISLFTRALSYDPQFIQAQNNRANLYKILGDDKSALDDYDEIIEKNPRYAPAFNNRGNLLFSRNDHKAALENYEKAVELDPVYTEAWSNKGNVEAASGNYNVALESYSKALAINPTHQGALLNKGSLLHALNNLDEAHSVYSFSVESHPDSWEPRYNRGIINQALTRFSDAIADYDACLKLNPEAIEARWNKSLCLLTLGNYQDGLDLYEERWSKPTPVRKLYDETKLWNGKEALSNQSVLVFAEQGYGDTIQFSRFIPYLAEYCAEITFAAQTALIPLLSSLDGISKLQDLDESAGSEKFHIPLLSLPRLLNLRRPIPPMKLQYLKSSLDSRRYWSEKLGKGARKRLGIAWKGSSSHPNDRNRSLSLKLFEKIICANYDFFSLCADPTKAELEILDSFNVRSEHNALIDFNQTAALIETLDLVVTVDTSIAHLSGALGKSAVILLPYCPDWRWGLHSQETAWYPTLKLLRQKKIGQWDSVIEDLQYLLDLPLG